MRTETLVIAEDGAVVTWDSDAAQERARCYERASLAPTTLRAYGQAWRDFGDWCALRGLASLPARPSSVAAYLAKLADRGRSISTIRICVAAIARAHALGAGDISDPTATIAVRQVVAGISRLRGTAPKKKDALTLERLALALDGLDGSLRALRDRALVLVGFAAALRRSELVALDIVDLSFRETGVVVTVRRSKTDQAGQGREIGIPFVTSGAPCPVRALLAWLEAAKISEGAVFRSFHRPRGRRAQGDLSHERLRAAAVGEIVQRITAAAGVHGDFGAHSLRAGFITSAVAAKVTEIEIARVSGHRSAEVLRGYVRRTNVMDAPPLSMIVGNARRIPGDARLEEKKTSSVLC